MSGKAAPTTYNCNRQRPEQNQFEAPLSLSLFQRKCEARRRRRVRKRHHQVTSTRFSTCQTSISPCFVVSFSGFCLFPAKKRRIGKEEMQILRSMWNSEEGYRILILLFVSVVMRQNLFFQKANEGLI